MDLVEMNGADHFRTRFTWKFRHNWFRKRSLARSRPGLPEDTVLKPNYGFKCLHQPVLTNSAEWRFFCTGNCLVKKQYTWHWHPFHHQIHCVSCHVERSHEALHTPHTHMQPTEILLRTSVFTRCLPIENNAPGSQHLDVGFTEDKIERVKSYLATGVGTTAAERVAVWPGGCLRTAEGRCGWWARGRPRWAAASRGEWSPRSHCAAAPGSGSGAAWWRWATPTLDSPCLSPPQTCPRTTSPADARSSARFPTLKDELKFDLRRCMRGRRPAGTFLWPQACGPSWLRLHNSTHFQHCFLPSATSDDFLTQNTDNLLRNVYVSCSCIAHLVHPGVWCCPHASMLHFAGGPSLGKMAHVLLFRPVTHNAKDKNFFSSTY